MDDTDHYVCTSLPNGRRVQVGPMSLPDARIIAAHLKTKSASWHTWVDWRRLNQWPLLGIEGFRAEVAPAPRQPTLPLGQFSDSILIEELKRRGFMVPKKSHVCDLTCQEVYPVHEYEAMARNSAWLESAQRSLARRIGELLLHNRAVEIEALAGGYGESILRVRAVVVAPEARHA